MTANVALLARKLAALERKVAALGSPQLAYSSLHDGAVNEYETVLGEDGLPVEDADGNTTDQLTAVIGQQFDGTHGIVVVAGPPPPVPAGTSLVAVPGGVELTWDGTWEPIPATDEAAATEVVAPSDWTHCEVHLATDAGLHGIFFATKRMEITSARGATVFIPVGGGVEVFGWLVARTAAGKYSLGPLAGPVAGGKLTEADLDVDLGTKVFYGSTDPATEGTVGAGSLWLKEPENVPYRREVSDLGVGSWVILRDPDIASALSQAAAAQSTANTKATVFSQASAPPTTGRTAGDIWVETDNGGKQYIWDGAWTPRLIGNSAIEPNSLVASNVIATGTISGALLEATAINGKTITGATFRTSDPAVTQQRVEITTADGLRGIDSTGAVKTQVSTSGLLTAVNATITGEIRTAITGPRIRMYQNGTTGTIEMYSGAATETPASLTASVPSGITKRIRLSSGSFNGLAGPTIDLETLKDGVNDMSSVTIDADYTQAKEFTATGTLLAGQIGGRIHSITARPVNPSAWSRVVADATDRLEGRLELNLNGTFTVVEWGWYEIVGTVWWAGRADGLRYAAIHINGVLDATSQAMSGVTSANTWSVSTAPGYHVYLEGGQTIDLRGLHTSTTALNLTANSNLTVKYLALPH